MILIGFTVCEFPLMTQHLLWAARGLHSMETLWRLVSSPGTLAYAIWALASI